MKRGWSFAVVAAVLSTAFTVTATTSAGAANEGFETWTIEEARASSPLLGEASKAEAEPSVGRKAAETFADQAGELLPAIQKELGKTFVSAAIDPAHGQRLVVVATTDASRILSPTLSSLDAGDAEVRIVENRDPAEVGEKQLAAALELPELGGVPVTQVARDDMTGQVVIGVDGDTVVAEQALAGSAAAGALVIYNPRAATTDGGTWGNNPARSTAPLAGGKSISTASSGGCTSAVGAVRQGSPVLVTAGHCISNNPSDTVYLSQGPYPPGITPLSAIGQTINYFSYDSNFDAALVSAGSGVSNCVIIGSGCTPISYRTTALLQGAPVSKSGSTTGETHGVVAAVSGASNVCSSGTPPCVYHLQAIITGGALTGAGDSGGVLWRSNGDGTVDPLGITSGGGVNGSVFTNWRIVCPYLGVDSCPAPFGPPPPPPLPNLKSTVQASAVQYGSTTRYFWNGIDGNLWNQTANGGTLVSGGMLAQGIRWQPGSTVTANGRPWVFWLGMDYNIYAGSLDPVSNTWITLSVAVYGAEGPPVVAAVGNAVHLYYRGQDGNLWHAYTTDGYGWSTDFIAPSITGWPAVTVTNQSHMYVYWRGSDGNLWESHLVGATWYHGNFVAPGILSVPSAASVSGTVHVFYTGQDRNLWHFYSAGHGFGYGSDRTATAIASAPAASAGGTTLYVHWTGTDNRVWGAQLNGTAWAMIPYGASNGSSGPIAVSTGNAQGATQVHWRAFDTNMYRRRMAAGTWLGGMQLSAYAVNA